MQYLANLGYVDVLLLFFLIWGLFGGFIKGFSGQFSKLVAVILGIIIGLMTYEPIGNALSKKTLMNKEVLSSLVLFGIASGTSFFLKLFFLLIGKVVSFQIVYFGERFLGGLLGCTRAFISFCFLSYIVLLWPTSFFKPYYQSLSYTGMYIEKVIPALKTQTDKLQKKLLASEGTNG